MREKQAAEASVSSLYPLFSRPQGPLTAGPPPTHTRPHLWKNCASPRRLRMTSNTTSEGGGCEASAAPPDDGGDSAPPAAPPCRKQVASSAAARPWRAAESPFVPPAGATPLPATRSTSSGRCEAELPTSAATASGQPACERGGESDKLHFRRSIEE